MSWSFSAIGRPEKVQQHAKEMITRSRCIEPEETIKARALDVVTAALEAYPSGMVVQVEASGSQGSTAGENKAANTLSIKITPLHGFVE